MSIAPYTIAVMILDLVPIKMRIIRIDVHNFSPGSGHRVRIVKGKGG
jgi:hypothetical protein